MPFFGRRLGRPNPLPFDIVHRSPDARSHSSSSAGEPASVSELDARSIGYPTSSHPGLTTGSPAVMPPRPRDPANRSPLPESRLGLPASRLRRLSASFTLTRLPVSSLGRRRTSTAGAVGVPRRRRSGNPCARGPRLPGDSVPEQGGFSLRPSPLPPRGPSPSPSADHPKVLGRRLGLPAPVGVRGGSRTRVLRIRTQKSTSLVPDCYFRRNEDQGQPEPAYFGVVSPAKARTLHG